MFILPYSIFKLATLFPLMSNSRYDITKLKSKNKAFMDNVTFIWANFLNLTKTKPQLKK